MNEQYENEKRKIKKDCRRGFGLVVGGLAALLIGGSFAMKKLNVDMEKYLPYLQTIVTLGIMAASGYYSIKEFTKLSNLDDIYDSFQ